MTERLYAKIIANIENKLAVGTREYLSTVACARAYVVVGHKQHREYSAQCAGSSCAYQSTKKHTNDQLLV
jgi:hypothetical protein